MRFWFFGLYRFLGNCFILGLMAVLAVIALAGKLIGIVLSGFPAGTLPIFVKGGLILLFIVMIAFIIGRDSK